MNVPSLSLPSRPADYDDDVEVDEDLSEGFYEGEMAEDDALILDAYISKERLIQLSGVSDLSEVKYLEMRVDTTTCTLGQLGTLLPNLDQLKLSNSILATVRDLGTTLGHIKVLWLSRCGLTELEGIGALASLQELYVAFNDVTDLSPLVSLEHLTVVDLESNAVGEMAQVQFLAALPQLMSLNLDGNPVTTVSGYRPSVCVLLPNLETLDDEPVSDADRHAAAAIIGTGGSAALAAVSSHAAAASPGVRAVREAREEAVAAKAEEIVNSPAGKKTALDVELRMLNDAIKYAKLDEELRAPDIVQAMAVSEDGKLVRPRSAFSSGSRTSRPSSKTLPSSRGSSSRSLTARPMTARGAPGSRGAGLTFGRAVSSLESSFGTSSRPTTASASELTFGSDDVFCGGAVKALRARGGENHARTIDLGDGSLGAILTKGMTPDGAAGASAAAGPGSGGGAAGGGTRKGEGKEDYAVLLEQLVAWKLSSGLDEMTFATQLTEEIDRELLATMERVAVAPSAPRAPKPSGAPTAHRLRVRSDSNGADNIIVNGAAAAAGHAPGSGPAGASGGITAGAAGNGASLGSPIGPGNPAPKMPLAPVPPPPLDRSGSFDRISLTASGKLRPQIKSAITTLRADQPATVEQQ